MHKSICLLVVILALPVLAHAAQRGRITHDVNFREGPNRSTRRIDVLKTGSEVEIVRRDPTGWYSIRYHGQTGFVHKAYVKPAPSGNSATPPNPETSNLLILAAMIFAGLGIIVVVARLAPFALKIASILGGSLIMVGAFNLGFQLDMLYTLTSVAFALLLLVLILTRKEKNRETPLYSVADRLRKAA